MRVSTCWGLTVAIFALAMAGCCEQTVTCCHHGEPETPAEGGIIYEPKTHVIKIVANPDSGMTGCIPIPEEPSQNKIWRGDSVIFKNEFEADALVFMAPGPFKEIIASFPVEKGNEKKMKVGQGIKHGHTYSFYVSCDPRGPGPGMRGDDPTRGG